MSKTDGKLWLAQFSNCDSSEEMATIEQLFRAKIGGSDDEGLRSLLGSVTSDAIV